MMYSDYQAPPATPHLQLIPTIESDNRSIVLRPNRLGLGYRLADGAEGFGPTDVENEIIPRVGRRGAVLGTQRETESDVYLPIIVKSTSSQEIRRLVADMTEVFNRANGMFKIMLTDPATGVTTYRRVAYREGLRSPEWMSPQAVKYSITADYVDPWAYSNHTEQVTLEVAPAATGGLRFTHPRRVTYEWAGVPYESESVKMVNGEEVARNRYPNPTFQDTTGSGFPDGLGQYNNGGAVGSWTITDDGIRLDTGLESVGRFGFRAQSLSKGPEDVFRVEFTADLAPGHRFAVYVDNTIDGSFSGASNQYITTNGRRVVELPLRQDSNGISSAFLWIDRLTGSDPGDSSVTVHSAHIVRAGDDSFDGDSPSEDHSGGVRIPVSFARSALTTDRLGTNTGDNPAPVTLRFNGPVTDPEIELVGLWRFAVRGTLQWDEYLVIDPMDSTATVYSTTGRNPRSAYNMMSVGSRFTDLEMPPGTHPFVFRALDDTYTATVEATWPHTYSGMI